MRIVCQKCAAAYAIDDRVITPKGVRAQCPRCRHLQLVKREDSPAPPVASPPAAAAPKPAAPAAKPAVAAQKPAAAKPVTSAPVPLTPSGSLSDNELFGDLGDIEPAADPNTSDDSLFGDLAGIGGSPASSPAEEKDSLFGDLDDLSQSSPSNPTNPTIEPRPGTPGYSIPSGDLLFDDIAPPPAAPKPAAPVARPAAPVQSKPPPPVAAAPVPLPEPADDGLFDFNSPPGFEPPPPAAPKPAAPVARPAAPVQSKPPPPVAAAPAALPAPEDDGIFDFNSPPGFEAPPVAAPKPAPPVAAAPAALPAPEDDGIFDFNSPPGFDSAPQPAAPASAAAAADPLLDFFGAPPAQPASPPAPSQVPIRTSMPVAAPAPVAPAAAPKACRECGKSLVDPFDQALGACEDCRQKAKPTPPPPAAKSVEVIDLPPLGDGAASPPPEPRSGVRPAAPTLTDESRSAVRGSAQRSPTAGVAVSASSGRGRGVVVGAVGLVLLLGGAGAAYFFVPQVKDAVASKGGGFEQSSDSSKQPSTSALPPAVEAVLPRWKIMFVDAAGGDSQQLLSEGQALLAKDQRIAYSQAVELFQRALLLDPKSDAAIGGYVQALALGSGARMDDKSFQEARSLIEAAEQRANRGPELLVAHANLLLARSGQSENVDQARKLAEEVLATAKDNVVAPKAEAHLILGRVFLTSSRELANQHFDSALAIASDLHRVHYYRALADETAGDYSLAIERLEKRLAQDPDHWETRTTLARILLEVGDVERARELYESRLKATPGDVQALLSLAVIRYQVEGLVPGALGALRGMLRNRDKYEEAEVAELLLHQATVERLSRNLDAATKSARESAELVKDNPAARLQLFLISVARKDSSAAAGHLTTLQGKLEDPVLEKLLEGRLRLLERKYAEAMERFLEASRMDPRRMDALLLAGVAAAQDGRRDEAFRMFAQVVQSDPLRLAPRPIVTPFFVRSADLLDGLEGSIVALSRGEDDLLAHLYEGLLRFHQGETSAAEKMFKLVNDVDDNNALASSYRTFLAVGRKDLKAAKAHAARAVVGGRQVAIAHLAQGLVLMGDSSQLELAKKSLRDAVTLAPKLYSAEVRLGELELDSNRNSVRERLVRLLGIDPSYLPAKRVLYLLDKKRG
jgi:predicted Zn finger-like uncharacterized protein